MTTAARKIFRYEAAKLHLADDDAGLENANLLQREAEHDAGRKTEQDALEDGHGLPGDRLH